MKDRLGEETGFTIIEVMFVTGIMVLALALLFGSMVSLAELDGIAEGQQIATAHLTTVMEGLRRLRVEDAAAYTPPPLADLGKSRSEIISDLPDEKITVECFDKAGAAITLPVDVKTLSEPLPSPLEVRVTVAWKGPRGRLHSISASALCARQ